jgi:ABC-type glutathione transport system ATPase component
MTSVPPRPLALAWDDLVVARGDRRWHWPRFELEAGGAAALVGPSGSGKTTLLLGMLGLLRGAEVRGAVRIGGETLARPGSNPWRACLRERVALVLQDARAALDALVPLGEQMRVATGAGNEDCAAALAALGIERGAGLLRRYPHEVSGGQAQRVLLAIALLRRPQLVLADEPTASLDGERAEDWLRHLQALRAQTGAATWFATHDEDFVQRVGAVRYELRDGEVVRAHESRLPWPAREPREPGEPMLVARGLGARYGGAWVFRGVDLVLRQGETVAVTGPSGGGKSTLARILAGLQSADEGGVEAPPRGGVQLLFQDAHGSLTPGRRLGGLLRETARPDFDAAGQATMLELPVAALGKTAATMSGGERRRAALLRALSVRPRVLVLDEPTAALDRAAATAVAREVLRLRALGVALLLVTHDRGLASAVADRVLTLAKGELC